MHHGFWQKLQTRKSCQMREKSKEMNLIQLSKQKFGKVWSKLRRLKQSSTCVVKANTYAGKPTYYILLQGQLVGLTRWKRPSSHLTDLFPVCSWVVFSHSVIISLLSPRLTPFRACPAVGTNGSSHLCAGRITPILYISINPLTAIMSLKGFEEDGVAQMTLRD